MTTKGNLAKNMVECIGGKYTCKSDVLCNNCMPNRLDIMESRCITVYDCSALVLFECSNNTSGDSREKKKIVLNFIFEFPHFGR